MISEKMVTLGTKKSVIREIFEYSKKRAAEIGTENVFDFSIGNPNVPAPASVHETIKELLDSKDDYYLFGYTSAQGDADTRAAVAADLNKRFGTTFHADNFYMTCGAAASLRRPWRFNRSGRRVYRIYPVLSGIPCFHRICRRSHDRNAG